MERVWLKTEPFENESIACGSIKSEVDDVNNIGPVTPPIITLTIIKDKEKSETAIVKVENELNECVPELSPLLTNDVHRKSAANAGTKHRSKGSQIKGKTTAKVTLILHSDSVERQFVCDECGKSFSRKKGLVRHKQSHSGKKPYICTECGTAFAQNSNLKSHRLIHNGEKPFVCEECGKKFASKFYLRTHQRVHTGELPFACDQCDQRFRLKESLTRHKLEHFGEKQFGCDECEMRFLEVRLLKSHKKTHTNDKPFICECGKGFFHQTSLNAHKREHSNEKPFGCDVCGKLFLRKGALNVHKVTHSTERPFGCELCGSRFTQKYTLKTHQMKQHGQVTSSATRRAKTKHSERSTKLTAEEFSSCDFDAPSESLRPSESKAIISTNEVHQKITPTTRTNELEQVEGPLMVRSGSTKRHLDNSCDVEIKVQSPESESISEASDDDFIEFKGKLEADCNVEMQQWEQIDEIASKSEQIEEKFKTDKQLTDYSYSKSERMSDEKVTVESNRKRNPNGDMENASVDLPFACEKCDRTFALTSALKNHQRSHMEREKVRFMCEECGLAFNLKYLLKIHLRTHSGLKPYSCDDCGKTFNQSSNLKAHKLTHTGEKKFACDECGARFSQKKNVLSHKRSAHTGEKLFSCDMCDKRFTTPHSAKVHKRTHTGEKPFNCDMCEKTFTQKSTLRMHYSTHTGVKSFACDECPSRFSANFELRRHKRLRHRKIGDPAPPPRRRKSKKKIKGKGKL